MGIPLGAQDLPGLSPVPAGPQRLLAGTGGGAQLAGPPARARRVPHVHFHGVVADRLVVLPGDDPQRVTLVLTGSRMRGGDVPGAAQVLHGSHLSVILPLTLSVQACLAK
ncbi:hypothetical protein Ae717Ps2_7165 [Pseudonocardia sp. Ae717_Ps2]|nr:hypothetical protein Ae717Ps2_7165 [Pseudonocardia sp. Ae717_Ps2]